MTKRLLPLCLLLLCCHPVLVPAHELHLKNGHIITTDNVWREGDTVHYEQYGGTVSIPYSLVKGVVYKTHRKEEEKATEQRTKTGRNIPQDKDLAAKLNKALSPKNPVEEASMCTLSVKTAAGFGSGFFISEDGYIITNKHVVRGSEKQFRQVEAKIAQSRRNLQQYKHSLDTASKRQKNYRDDLEAQDALLEKLKKTGRIDRADFKAKQQELHDAEQLLREEEKRFAAAKKEYRAAKHSFDQETEKFHRSRRKLAGQGSFTIILADETELYASLYRVSDKHDLALLKISGYKTPFLRPAPEQDLVQGQKVFAVGSPVDLRLKNTVTSGILSAFRDNFIQTNAQIYPGNSGGPLIDSKGRVIGVNTKKLITEKFEGLGFAIPVRLVFSEFEDYLF